jgi:tetratricopeptide (TPR) repeat protein
MADSCPSVRATASLWAVRVLAAAIIYSAARQAWTLGCAVAAHPTAPGTWMLVAGSLPIVILAVVGAQAIARNRVWGFFPLYLTIALGLSHWGFPLVPFVPSWLEPKSPVRPLSGLGATNLLMLAFLLAAHARLHCLHAPVPWRAWCIISSRALGITAAVLYLMVSVAWYRHLERLAGERVAEGLAAFEAGQDNDALASWQQAIDRYPYTNNWGAAVNNCGWLHEERGRYAEAIPFFQMLLDSDLDDRTPNPHLMDMYRNYHHRACLHLSTCFEKLGDVARALDYARLARDRYPYQSWCLTCRSFAARDLGRRIARLEAIQAGQPEPAEERDDDDGKAGHR